MFVSSSAFYTLIADPVIGGTYLTLLNTVSNLGGTWPRFFILAGVDYFTKATCIFPETLDLEGFPLKSPGDADCSAILCDRTKKSAMSRGRR